MGIAIATQQIKNYVSIARNFYRKLLANWEEISKIVLASLPAYVNVTGLVKITAINDLTSKIITLSSRRSCTASENPSSGW